MVTSFSVRADTSEELRKEYEATLNSMDVNALVREFFSYLDYKDETDSGTEFNPIVISSCHVLMTQPLNMCINKLRERIK